MSESLSIEDQENFMFCVATQRYLDTEWTGTSYSWLRRERREWLESRVGVDKEYHERWDCELFQDEIRRLAQDTLCDLNDRYDVEDVDRIDMDNHYDAAQYSYLAISRDVATQMAIDYFTQLRAYLKARETGDQAIDEITQGVATSANLLLRQIESVVPNFQPSERTEENRDYIRSNLNLLIDFDRVSRESGFMNAFTVSDIANFEAITAEDACFGVTNNTYGGLRPIDILQYLNSSNDVVLHDSESTPFVKINRDGIVDIDLEREILLKTGIDMAIEKISDADQESLARQIVFSAQATPFDDVDLTIETLEQNGLLPKWMVRFGDATIYLTDKLFREESKKKQRPKTIIYIKDEEKGIVARSCYKSNSQVVWRLLPAYSGRWYSKANNEEQLTLTPELQRALSYLCQTEQMQEAEVVFYGAAKKGLSLAKSFQTEIKCEPVMLGQGFFIEGSFSRPEKVDPKDSESFKFDDEEDKPDFSKLIDSWTEETDLCGEVNYELFESRNGRLRYIFCCDTRGRAWISGIDLKDAKITSQGIKEQWIRGGDLCTPVFEYWKQAGGYENPNYGAGEERQYTDMYENYLRHIPLIQEYKSSVAARAA